MANKMEWDFIPKNAVTFCNKCMLRQPKATCKKYPKGIPFEVLISKAPCKEFSRNNYQIAN